VDQRDVPYHVTSCSAIKLGGVGSGGVRGASAGEQAEHLSVGGEQLFSFASLGFYFAPFVIFLFIRMYC